MANARPRGLRIWYNSIFVLFKTKQKKVCLLLGIVPDPHHLASWRQTLIPIKVKTLIRIRIEIKSRIRIYTRMKSQKLWGLTIEQVGSLCGPWRLTMVRRLSVEPWQIFWPEVAYSRQFDEEPHPKPQQSEGQIQTHFKVKSLVRIRINMIRIASYWCRSATLLEGNLLGSLISLVFMFKS